MDSAVEATQAVPLCLGEGTVADSSIHNHSNNHNGGSNSDGNKQQVTSSSSCWGYLARGETRFLLHVREPREGRINAHVLGRNLDCDVVVAEKRVSGKHCVVYCEYESIMARMRVYVEDMSQNGTYVNGTETRLRKGERYELKSGDELFLSRPSSRGESLTEGHFIFVNTRERDIVQRNVLAAQTWSEGTDRVEESQDTKLDKYEIGPQIGLGTCGTVHTCREHATGEQFAIKIVDLRKLTLSAGGASINELAAEAEIMRSLNHPNIITVHESWQTSQAIYIVMELVRGGDLFERVVQRNHYSEDNARTLMVALLSAVKYLHDKGIVHRDLKPENILLTDPYDDVSIKITDFGLAKRISEEGLKTFCGTPQYFAPEVLKRRTTVHGRGRYGTAADMWSVGVVLYVLLTGTPPFDENRLFNQIEQADICMQGPEWWGVSDSAKHLVRSLLTIDPRERLTVDQAQQHPWMTNSPFSTETFYSTVRRQLSTSKFSSAKPVHEAAPEARAGAVPPSKPAVPKKRRRTTTVTRPAVPLEIVHLDTGSAKRSHKPASGHQGASGPQMPAPAPATTTHHSNDENGATNSEQSLLFQWRLTREIPLPRKEEEEEATAETPGPGIPSADDISDFSSDDELPNPKRKQILGTSNGQKESEAADHSHPVRLKTSNKVVRKQPTLAALFTVSK